MKRAPTPQSQSGISLVISLVLLLVLTIIAVTGASTSSLELMIATNGQFSGDAFARAEDSVLAGERYLAANHTGTGGPAFDFSLDATDGLYDAGVIDVQSADWSAFNTERVIEDGELVAEYVIEYLGPVAGSGGSLAAGTGGTGSVQYLYRVTGRGDSPGGSVRLVQTIFAAE